MNWSFEFPDSFRADLTSLTSAGRNEAVLLLRVKTDPWTDWQTDYILLQTHVCIISDGFLSVFEPLLVHKPLQRPKCVFQTSSYYSSGERTLNCTHQRQWLNYIYQEMSWKLQPSTGGGLPLHHSFPWVNKYELDLNAHPPSFTSTLLLVMQFIPVSLCLLFLLHSGVVAVGLCPLQMPWGKGHQLACAPSTGQIYHFFYSGCQFLILFQSLNCKLIKASKLKTKCTKARSDINIPKKTFSWGVFKGISRLKFFIKV